MMTNYFYLRSFKPETSIFRKDKLTNNSTVRTTKSSVSSASVATKCLKEAHALGGVFNVNSNDLTPVVSDYRPIVL
ncbi:hypothetical protein B5X24_HaOG210668 [Helicoverpa armigera]|nr:hypothetical protein B5X24_HaOG210668 [Helicoverpa armigera]